jgi:hypothetical protein
MGNPVPLIIQLVSGAVGGNLAGSLLKKFSLGTVLNSIVGILGGGPGGQLLNALGIAGTGGGMDIGGIVGSIAAGGVGGGVLMGIIGAIKKAVSLQNPGGAGRVRDSRGYVYRRPGQRFRPRGTPRTSVQAFLREFEACVFPPVGPLEQEGEYQADEA